MDIQPASQPTEKSKGASVLLLRGGIVTSSDELNVGIKDTGISQVCKSDRGVKASNFT